MLAGSGCKAASTACAAPGQDRLPGRGSGSAANALAVWARLLCQQPSSPPECQVRRETDSARPSAPPMPRFCFYPQRPVHPVLCPGASRPKKLANRQSLIYKVGIRRRNGFPGFVQTVKRDAKRCLFYVQLASSVNDNTSFMLEVTDDTL